jgi:ABC-type multidrug transport system fused ATPase/permease subunit
MENIKEEIECKTEAKGEITWPPTSGSIEFKNVSLRYRPGLDFALQNMNFKVESGTKVGIVGRTGAGKSTLGLALTRLVELHKGKILIDGTDIASVPL